MATALPIEAPSVQLEYSDGVEVLLWALFLKRSVRVKKGNDNTLKSGCVYQYTIRALRQ